MAVCVCVLYNDDRLANCDNDVDFAANAIGVVRVNDGTIAVCAIVLVGVAVVAGVLVIAVDCWL